VFELLPLVQYHLMLVDLQYTHCNTTSLCYYNLSYTCTIINPDAIFSCRLCTITTSYITCLSPCFHGDVLLIGIDHLMHWYTFLLIALVLNVLYHALGLSVLMLYTNATGGVVCILNAGFIIILLTVIITLGLAT
jgi:hypothetical protein